MDSTDRKILNILQSDARTPNAELARQVGMAPSAVLERVRKLEERGVIRGYHARLDPKLLDHGLLAFVLVRTEEHAGYAASEEQLMDIPEVQEVHHVAGQDCFLLKVRVANTDALSVLLRDRIGALRGVRSTNTTIVLQTVKESAAIPVVTE
jgi:Lrp/AsnC family leucine-responsive transcriptional regulator